MSIHDPVHKKKLYLYTYAKYETNAEIVKQEPEKKDRSKKKHKNVQTSSRVKK